MKLSKDKRDRIILVVLLTLAVSWGLWQFVVRTRTSGLAAQRLELDKQRRDLAQAEDWIERAQAVEEEMTEALEGLAKVEDQLANRVDPYAWSYLLLDTIRRSHPALRGLDVAGKPSVGPVRLLPDYPYEAATFTVVGRGHYHEFGRFLAQFENEYPFFQLQNIELTSRSMMTDSQAIRDEREMLNLKFDVVALLKPPSN
jgi:hypothetical protein